MGVGILQPGAGINPRNTTTEEKGGERITKNRKGEKRLLQDFFSQGGKGKEVQQSHRAVAVSGTGGGQARERLSRGEPTGQSGGGRTNVGNSYRNTQSGVMGRFNADFKGGRERPLGETPSA